ncbi:unnamed protein product, partial [Tuber aestivum]
ADISGNFSGNSGDHNVFGSNNIGSLNTGNLNHVTNLYQGCVFGAGDKEEASRPYRIIPYRRNSKFTGREDLIELVKRLSEGSGQNRIALHGLGGSGKTQIALEYVYQRAGESDCHVFWVHGSGAQKFSEGFRAIAHHVRIPLASTDTDQEELLASIKRWFEGPDSGDWILVIDNADDEEDFIGNSGPISKFVPQGQRGTLIFTTRSLRVASWQDCERIDVGKMGEDEAGALFLKRYGNRNTLGEEENEAIALILGYLHHIPLAIIGAAAFMTETQTLPSVYLTIFRGSDEHAKRLLSQPFCDIQREADMTESILATYFVTFDRITRQIPLAAELLRLIAFFDRQNIPEELLNQSGLEGMDDPIEFRQAIGKLFGFSLVTSVKIQDKTFYELHRLVQLSLHVYLPTEELNRWRATALGVISRLFPRNWNAGRYVVQLRRCTALRKESNGCDWDEEGARRVMLLGRVNVYQGKADVAEKLLRDLLEEIEESLGLNNPMVLQAFYSLALALRDRGKYGESEAVGRRALEGLERILGLDHPDTLTSLNNLANVLESQGKYHESEEMNRRALEGYQRILGPDHRDTLTSLNNIAGVLESQGKYDESEAMNRRALEGREKVLGPEHPDTLTSLNNLANVLRSQGKYDESEAMNRRALEGREKVLGPDHPDTLASLSNLATIVLESQGRYDESEAMNRRVLEDSVKILGPDHPNTLTSLDNLANVLESQGKYDESEAMHRRGLEGSERILGPDHPDTLTSLNNIANVLRSQGKY